MPIRHCNLLVFSFYYPKNLFFFFFPNKGDFISLDASKMPSLEMIPLLSRVFSGRISCVKLFL